jgi:hypothetical protein
MEGAIMHCVDRRYFLKLAGLAGVTFASGLGAGPALGAEDFFFVQMTDMHWGFKGAPNPEAHNTLQRGIAAVNALARQPDFVVFTGDLTHTTDDGQERRRRLAEVRDIANGLTVKNLRFMPGEHDAALDKGAAYQEFFGALYYSFDHKGVHFIALDNTSDPGASLGQPQLDWLRADLQQLGPNQPIVVLAHRPLFDLAPDWDRATRDGKAALDLLMPYRNVSVFYGHIHQEHHHMTGHIAHHAATSLIFPLPAPMSQPRRAPLAWNPEAPFKGLGFRSVEGRGTQAKLDLTEHALQA